MIRGQCFCGSVRFHFEPPSDFCSHCHCQSCRRSHAAGFVTWTSVAAERFHLEDPEGRLQSYASSSEVAWQFCSRCGSSMLYRATFTPERVYIAVGSLVDPLDRAPDGHVSYEEHLAWVEGGDSLPKFVGKTDQRWAR